MSGPDQTPQWLVILAPPRPTFADDADDDERALIGRHFDYLSHLAERGAVLLAGRTQDEPPMGLVILAAPDQAEARAIIDADPAVAAGVFTAQLRPYRIAIGP